MIKVNDNTLFLTISVPDNANKISITNPALKNNVVVNDARITPSERAKLAGIEEGATADQTLTSPDGNIVLENGPDYEISLADSITLNNDLTAVDAFVDRVLVKDTSTGTLPPGVTAAVFYVGTDNKTYLKSKGTGDFTLQSLGNIRVINGNTGSTTIGDLQSIRVLSIGSNGLVVRTNNGSNQGFSFNNDGVLSIGSSNPYKFPVNRTGASQGDVLKLAADGETLIFGETLTDLSTSEFNDLSDVDVDYNDWNGYTQGPNILYNALVYDGTNWVMYNSVQGSFPPNTTNTSFLGDAAPIDKSKIGFDSFNNGLSINSDTSYASSGINLYVNGGARVDGAIQVNDPSSTGYAFPTADGTANQLLATNGSGAVTFVTPSTSNVTEGTNLYYTDARVAANSAVAANTAKTSFPGFGTTAGTALEGNTALFDGQYSSLTGVPSTFAPSAHTHTASEITDFDTEVSNNTSVAANTAKVSYTDAAVDSRIAAASIDDLSDVDTSTVAPTDGQALVWDNANSKWEPGSVSGGSSSLSGLTDTSITSPGAGEALVYNNDTSVWENAEALVELKTSVDAWIYSGNEYYMGAAGSAETNPLGIYFKPDGTRMFISGRNDDRIKEFSLSTAWDITTSSYVQESASLSNLDGNIAGLFFKSDGTKVYLCGYGNDRIGEWTLSTAWDVSTMGSLQYYDTTNDGYATPYGLDLKPDGTEIYLATWDVKKVAQYTMSTAFDISTLSFTREFDVSNETSNHLNSVRFADNGTRMIIMDEAESFFEYSLSTAWDISTATFLTESTSPSPNSNNDDFFYYEGGDKVFVISDGSDSVYEYSAKNYNSSRGLALGAGISAGSGSLSGGAITGTSLNVGGGSVTAGGGNFSGAVSITNNLFNNGWFKGARSNAQAELAVWNNINGTANKYIKLGGNSSSSSDWRTRDSYRHPATPGNHIIELGARGASITHIENLTELQEVTVNDNIIVYGNPKVEDTNPTATGTTIYNDTFTETSDTALGSHTSNSGHTYSTIFDDTGGNGPNLTVFGGTGQAGMDQSIDNEGQTFVSSAVTSGVDYELVWNYQVDLTGINGSDLINFPFGVVDSNNYFLLCAAWNSDGSSNGNNALVRVINGVGSEVVADPFSYHSLTISSNTAYDVKIKLVDRQHYIYHDNTLIWSGYLDGFPYDTDHGAGIGIGDRIWNSGRESHVNYKFNSVTQKEYQASDFTYPSSYIENGNFGIGTTSPSEALHVAGQIKVDDGANPFTLPASDGSASQVLQTDGSGTVSWATVSGGGSSVWTTSGSDIYYTTGNVGIGTTTPSQPLHVDGNAKINGILDLRNSLDTDAGVIQVTDVGAGNVSVGIGNMTSVGIRHIGIGEINNTSRSDYVGIGPRGVGGGNQSVVIGDEVAGNNSGTGIVSIGQNSSRFSSGSYSVAIGNRTLYGLGGQGGAYSVAIGAQAMDKAAQYSVAVGANTVKHTSGANNVGIGHNAGLGVSGSSTFANTVAVGYEALTALTTGTGNTAVGYQAGAALTTSSNNTVVGYQAGSLATGSDNTLLGYLAGEDLTSGNSNTALGAYALKNITTGSGNTSIGWSSGANWSTTSSNVAVGMYAANANTGSNNVALGHESQRYNRGSDNISIGKDALFGTHPQSANNNVAIGTNTLRAVGTGADNNVGVGYASLAATTGSNTVAVGYQALTALTTGAQNTAVGYQAGAALTTGTNNTFLGYQAGDSIVQSNNTIIGSGAGVNLANVSGAVIMGSGAAAAANGTTYGVVIGYQAAGSATQNAGNSGVVIGFRAGQSNTGTGNVLLGANSGWTGNGSNNVFIGTNSGYSETGSNKLYIENSNSTTPLIYGEFDNDILKVNGTLEPTKGVVNEGGSGFASTGDYGSGAEITYLGSSSTSTFVGRVYYYDGTTWQAFSSSTEAAQKALLGIALGSTMASGFLLKGFIQPDGVSITAAQQVFGATNAAITGTAPTSGYQRVMGHAVSSTVIHFNPSQEYIDLV